MIEHYRSQLDEDPQLEKVTLTVQVLPSGEVRGIELLRRSARRRPRPGRQAAQGPMGAGPIP